MTDLHLSFLRPPARISFLDSLRSSFPDVVLITGDTGEAKNFQDYLAEIASVTGAPVYFVLGNHDFFGASIDQTRTLAREATLRSPVKWLTSLEPVLLTPDVTLVGVDGWGDGRCGTPEGFRVRLNDWKHIEDLRGLQSWQLLEKLQALGTAEAARLKKTLSKVAGRLSLTEESSSVRDATIPSNKVMSNTS